MLVSNVCHHNIRIIITAGSRRLSFSLIFSLLSKVPLQFMVFMFDLCCICDLALASCRGRCIVHTFNLCSILLPLHRSSAVDRHDIRAFLHTVSCTRTCVRCCCIYGCCLLPGTVTDESIETPKSMTDISIVSRRYE